jgi:hypothetical protein
MRDNMPQPNQTRDSVTLYAQTVWEEARGLYLRVALGASVVSATIGGLVGYTLAGGFN